MRLASPYVGLLGCVVSATPLLISQWVLLGYFYRNAIPTDLLEQNPQPTGWGEPSAFLSPGGCNLTEHFFNHQIVFGKFWFIFGCKNNSQYPMQISHFVVRFFFCKQFMAWTALTLAQGDWAGNSYATSGCPGTCAERIQDPSNFVASSSISCFFDLH